MVGRDAADPAELVVGVVAAPESALPCVDVDEGVLQRVAGPLRQKEELAAIGQFARQLHLEEVGPFGLQGDCVVLL